MVLLDHRISNNKGSVVGEFSYPPDSGRFHPWNLSGSWKPGDGNYFALGGIGNGTQIKKNQKLMLVYLWDIRAPKLPVSTRDLGLGKDELILSTRFIDDQILGMGEKQLVVSFSC